MWQAVGWGLSLWEGSGAYCAPASRSGVILCLGILMTLSQETRRKSGEKAFLGEKPRPLPGTGRGVGPVWPVRGRGSSVLTRAPRGGWAALAARSQPLAWQWCTTLLLHRRTWAPLGVAGGVGMPLPRRISAVPRVHLPRHLPGRPLV